MTGELPDDESKTSGKQDAVSIDKSVGALNLGAPSDRPQTLVAASTAPLPSTDTAIKPSLPEDAVSVDGSIDKPPN